MTWLNNIQDLQYYHPIAGIPCFCEILIYPNDMILQGSFTPGSGNYTLLLEVMSADGKTVYANGTSYFSSYFFSGLPTVNQHFFNAQLNSFVPAMCAYACYIIHAKVTDGSTVLFDKYTERYCQSSCCDLARNIHIEQDGILISTGVTEGGDTVTPFNPKVTDCGETLITLRTRFDCYDKFLGLFYGVPGSTLSGTASFGFENISNFRGRIVQRPREIKREYSYNCRLQRVESTKQYLFEGFEYFPAWKMNEIEAQLHSTRIYVDDVRYEYSGGTPFTLVANKSCIEVFKLSAIMSDCTQRQVFGCDTSCSSPVNFDGAMKMYVIPDAATGTLFYDESGMTVGYDYAALLIWLRGLPGITEVNDINITGLDCAVYKAVSISGTGYIPTYFYYDAVTSGTKVFATVLDSIDTICTQYANPCIKPVIVEDDIVVEDNTCPAPDLGEATVEDMTASDIPLENRGDWEVNAVSSSASLWNGQVTLNIVADNTEIPEDPENPGDPVTLQQEEIAVIGGTGRPDNDVTLDSNNSNMPVDTALIITANGIIIFTGPATSSDSGGSNITLTNIRYNIH